MPDSGRKLGLLHANDWTGRVRLDGEDVSGRCQAVVVRGERPIGVILYKLVPEAEMARLGLDPHQSSRFYCVRRRGGGRELAREYRRGAVAHSLRRRPVPLRITGTMDYNPVERWP